MQVETMKSDRDFLKQMIEVGERHSAEPEPDKQEISVKQIIRDNMKAMLEAGEKGSPQISHDKPNYNKISDERKMELCTRNSSICGVAKMIGGNAKLFPRYCDKCPKCLEANMIKLKVRIEGFKNIAENSDKDGAWRMKTVNEGNEADALKKRIKRNQDDIRFDCTSSEPGKVEVWAYVENEPSKNMDEVYGEKANPDNIDTDNLYKRNRENGKKLSTGSGLKFKSAMAEKQDTERLIVPEIIIADVTRQAEAVTIIEQTNYVEKAKDAGHATRLYTFQFKYILQELKAANIEIAAIKMNYFNMAKSEILESWNENVEFWMSMFNSIPKNIEPNLDITAHLHFPTEYKSEIVQ